MSSAELDRIRELLEGVALDGRRALNSRDFLEAVVVFLLVVIAILPVVVPLLHFDTLAAAMRASRLITLAMLFLAGLTLGRYGGYRQPLLTSVAMALFGALLIGIVMALGG